MDDKEDREVTFQEIQQTLRKNLENAAEQYNNHCMHVSKVYLTFTNLLEFKRI